MRQPLLSLFCVLCASLAVCSGCSDDLGSEPAAETNFPAAVTVGTSATKVLIYSRTAGFRHGSIEAAKTALSALVKDRDWTLILSENPADLTKDKLKDVKAVVFLMTTGDALDQAAQEGVEAFVRGGGGWVGVHSASDTEYSWPWYAKLVGAYFKGHTAADTDGVAIVSDRVHPATKHLPTVWSRKEEWYEFKSNPRGTAHILMTVDKGAMGHDHPHAWCHNYDGGRAFYTAGGHSDAAWADKPFLDHVAAAIDWAAGTVKGDCSATVDASYKAEKLVDLKLKDPMELNVGPTGKVYWIHREGLMSVWDPATKAIAEVGTFDIEASNEDGLMGFALDPKFADNGYMWVYHSVKTPSENHLSRFTVKNDKVDLGSIKTYLKVPVQRKTCCHSGGNVEFGSDGSLYLSVGDNTNPFECNSFSPMDERVGREAFDAQRTAGNTDDLRGKILRIMPKDDGTYDIPKENLFADGKDGRKEIFVMGVRNPFRIAPDPKSNFLYWAETGPDASVDKPERGPRGYDEVNRADKGGHFGWPHCIGPNYAYMDFDFATGKTGAKYDCAKIANSSPNNTGLKTLPAAQPAMIWYPYDASPDFPILVKGVGRAAMAGVLYRNKGAAADMPTYLDGKLIWIDWQRSWIFETTVSDDGKAVKINRFLSGLNIQRPIDMQVGPDGAIYVLEWGKEYGSPNPDARITKVTYTAK